MSQESSKGSSSATNSMLRAAQAAGNIKGAVKTGKAIAGAAKGAAGGPYGMAASLIWQNRKLIGKVLAALCLLPVLFIAMLPSMIFGTGNDPIRDAGTDALIMNDNDAIIENLLEINSRLHEIIQEGLADVNGRVESDFRGSGGDEMEVTNPYIGGYVMDPLLIISQFCALHMDTYEEIDLDSLVTMVLNEKGKLFSYTKETRTETRTETKSVYNGRTRQYEDVEVEVEVTIVTYIIKYNGETHLADEVFHLDDDQKSIAYDYHRNLQLLLADFDNIPLELSDLIRQFPYSGVAGDFISPFHDRDWRSCVTSEFDYRNDPETGLIDKHRGIDLAAPGGTPIHAVRGGVVIIASPWVNTYGNYVAINHGDGMVTLYAHCSSLAVNVGDVVEQGDIIAYVGNTGRVYGDGGGYHLHLEVQVDGELINPRVYLP